MSTPLVDFPKLLNSRIQIWQHLSIIFAGRCSSIGTHTSNISTPLGHFHWLLDESKQRGSGQLWNTFESLCRELVPGKLVPGKLVPGKAAPAQAGVSFFEKTDCHIYIW